MTGTQAQIDAMFDGSLNEQGVRELGDWLLADAEHALAFVRQSILHAELWEQMRANPAADSEPIGRIGAARRSARCGRVGVYAAAGLIVLSFGLLMNWMFQHAGRDNRPAVGEFFATLTDARDAVFADAAATPTPGAMLRGGFLRLASGTAELEFLSGARVTLTGPAEFGVNSAMRGFLRSGKLRATVPHSAKGFTVGAPGLAVVDLGTEFGMSVDHAGRTRVNVLKGHVRVEPDGGEPIHLHRDAVVSLDHNARLLARRTVVSTADRGGNDAFIQNDGKSFHFTPQLTVKNDAANPALDRRAYLRFNLKGVRELPTSAGAALLLHLRNIAEKDVGVAVWALRGDPGPDRTLGLALNWHNAPGLRPGTSGEADDSQATLLARFTVPATAKPGDAIAIELPRLLELLHHQRGGALTLILVPMDTSSQPVAFDSRRQAGDTAPKLIFDENHSLTKGED